MASAYFITIPRTAAYTSRQTHQFLQLKSDGDLIDFTIRSGTKSFECHKFILASSSPVLKAMVMSNMAEASKREAELSDTPPEVVQLLLHYMYTGVAIIPNELLVDTVKACDYLDLLELKEMCLSQAVTTIAPSNVISWYNLADDLEIDELKSSCSEILSTSFAEVSKENEFRALGFTEMSSYFSNAQETNVDYDVLLKATLGWVSHKPSQRLDCMEDLLQKIQLLNCSVECLEEEVETHEALLDSRPRVYKLLVKTLTEIAKQDGVRKKRTTNYPTKTTTIVIGGNNTDELNKVCWELDSCMQFVELCKIPEFSVRLSVCKIPDGFVLTGGEGCVLCSMYISSTKSWKDLTPLPAPRHAHASIFSHGKICVFGGVISGTYSSSVQSLKLAGGRWEDEPALPVTVRYPEVACVDASIFLLDVFMNNQLLHLNMKRNRWSSKAALPGPSCWGARMISVQRELLVAGGEGQTFARYSPSTDTWCTGNTPKLKHNFGALVYRDQNLYLMGGYNEDRVEEFDHGTESWSVCDVKIPRKLCDLHALSLDG